MEIRLIPEQGGDGSRLCVGVLNDTGSNVMTLLDLDLDRLGNLWGYNGWLTPSAVENASGDLEMLPTVCLQARLVTEGFVPWSEWFEEVAIVRRARPGITRLSGAGIRRGFYFGTSPGNQVLSVGGTRGGMASLLEL